MSDAVLYKSNTLKSCLENNYPVDNKELGTIDNKASHVMKLKTHQRN